MRKHMILIALFSTFIVLAACGTGENDPVEEDSVVDKDDQSTEETDKEDEEETSTNEDDKQEDVDSEKDVTEDDQSKDQNEEKVTATGIYNGQADPHTIEIETDEGPVAFQLTMEARDDIDALTVDEEVEYTYTEDGDQRTIEVIKLVE